MSPDAAATLALRLRRESLPLERGGRLRLRADVEGGRIVFSGGLRGSHSLDLAASSEERVLAHWDGYCEASLRVRPEPGDVVEFPSASAWREGGYRRGRVVSVGPKRAVVTARYKHGGGLTTRVRLEELRVAAR